MRSQFVMGANKITDIGFCFFSSQLSLPADIVDLNIRHERLFTTYVDQTTVFKHISRFVEDIKLLQVQ